MKTLIVHAKEFPNVLKLTQHLCKLARKCNVFLDISDFDIDLEDLQKLGLRFKNSNFTLTWDDGLVQTPLKSFSK